MPYAADCNTEIEIENVFGTVMKTNYVLNVHKKHIPQVIDIICSIKGEQMRDNLEETLNKQTFLIVQKGNMVLHFYNRYIYENYFFRHTLMDIDLFLETKGTCIKEGN